MPWMVRQGQGIAEPADLPVWLSDFGWAWVSCENLAFLSKRCGGKVLRNWSTALNFDKRIQTDYSWCKRKKKKRPLTGISLSCQHATLAAACEALWTGYCSVLWSLAPALSLCKFLLLSYCPQKQFCKCLVLALAVTWLMDALLLTVLLASLTLHRWKKRLEMLMWGREEGMQDIGTVNVEVETCP